MNSILRFISLIFFNNYSLNAVAGVIQWITKLRIFRNRVAKMTLTNNFVRFQTYTKNHV